MRKALLALALAIATPAAAQAPEKDLPVREYKKVLEKSPTDREVRHKLAARLADLGRLPESRAEYEKLRANDANDAVAAYNLGVVLNRQLDWDALEALLASVTPTTQSARAADYARLWHNLGSARERASVDKAREAYQKALDLGPDRAATRIALASLQLRGGGGIEAALLTLQATDTAKLPPELRRPYAETVALLAATLLDGGRVDDASLWLDKAKATVNPPPFSVMFNSALIAEKKGDVAGARTIARSFKPAEVPAPYKPHLAAFLYNLGLAARDGGDSYTALLDLERALEVVPTDTPSMLVLARLYEKEQRHGDAVKTAKRCVDLEPGNDDCRVAFADTYIEARRLFGEQADLAVRKGQHEAAKSVLRKALEIDPDDEILKERLAELDNERTSVAALNSQYNQALTAGQWDAAADVLLALWEKTPEDENVKKREQELKTKEQADRAALRRKADSLARKGKLYESFLATKRHVELAPNDASAKAQMAAADASWQKGYAEDREKVKKLNAERKYAQARALLVKWDDQGVEDATLDSQIEALGTLAEQQVADTKKKAQDEAKAGNWKSAKATYVEVLSMDPKDKAAKEGASTAEAHLDPSKAQTRGRELYSEGVLLYSKGQYQDAIDKWSELATIPGAGEWATKARNNIERAKKILELAEQAQRSK